jgi:preprotein translocase subunit SecB
MTEVLQRISHIIAAVQLQSVRLVESTAKANIRSPKEVGKIDMFVDTSTQPPELPEDGLLYIQPTIHTLVTSQDKTVVSIMATYELIYIIPKELKVTQDELNDFARLNAMFNVWPYWREFVQSTITRMNLPPLVLPLFRVKEAAKQVEQESQRAATPVQA